MRLLSVSIRNFLIVSEADYRLDNLGLVLIAGENKDVSSFDSNGSGKTASFVDSLLWCFWGKTSIKNLGADAVVRKGQKNCSVIIELEDEDTNQQIVISRYRKHSKFKNSLILEIDGQNVTGSSSSDTQSRIEQILGIDFNTFMNSVVFSQRLVKKFTEMTDKEQKETLEAILNFDWIVKAYDKASQDAKDLQKSLTEINAEIEDVQSEQEKVKAAIKRYEDEHLSFERSKKANIAAATLALKDLNFKYKKALNAVVGNPSSVVEECKNRLDIAEEFLGEKSDEFREKKKLLANRLHDLSLNQVRQNSVVNRLKEEIQKIEDLVRNKKCPKCGQPVTKDHSKNEVEEIMVQIDLAIDTQNNIAVEKAALEKEINAIEEKWDKRRKKIAKQISVLRDEYTTAKVNLRVEEEKVERVKELKNLYSTKKKELDDWKKAESVYGTLLEEKSQEEYTLYQQLIILTARKKLAEQRLSIALYWKEAFGLHGIRSILLDGVAFTLNESANRYSEILTGGAISIKFSTLTKLKSGEFRDSFNVEAINSSGADSYFANSAGEKRRVDLCVALALSELIAKRARKRFNVVILDEVFVHLDDSGITAVLGLLRELSQDKESVLVITHSDWLAEEFSNKIVVRRKGNAAKVIQ